MAIQQCVVDPTCVFCHLNDSRQFITKIFKKISFWIFETLVKERQQSLFVPTIVIVRNSQILWFRYENK